MAKLNEQDFKKEMTSKEPSGLYLIYGEEKYLVRKYTEALVRKTVGKKGEEFDYFRMNADTPLEQIFDAADQLPVMAEKKCVCVTDYEINALPEGDYQQLEKFCSDVATTTVLIFSMPTYSPDAKKKTAGKGSAGRFGKFVSFAEKHGTALELNKLGEIAIERQLTAWCEKNGCKLTPINASKIISRVGTDLTALKNETDKLCGYADGKEITEEMIRLLCVKNTEARIYAIADYIVKNDFNATYQQLQLLFAQNERPEMILSVLSSAFVDMYRMRAAGEAGISVSQAAADFQYGKRDFVLKNAARNVTRFSTESLRQILEVILDTDIRLKSTRADAQTLIETMVAKLLLIVKKDGHV